MEAVDSVEKDTVMDVDESSDDESVAEILAHLRMQTASPQPRKMRKWRLRFSAQVIEVPKETEKQT